MSSDKEKEETDQETAVWTCGADGFWYRFKYKNTPYCQNDTSVLRVNSCFQKTCIPIL